MDDAAGDPWLLRLLDFAEYEFIVAELICWAIPRRLDLDSPNAKCEVLDRGTAFAIGTDGNQIEPRWLFEHQNQQATGPHGCLGAGYAGRADGMAARLHRCHHLSADRRHHRFLVFAVKAGFPKSAQLSPEVQPDHADHCRQHENRY